MLLQDIFGETQHNTNIAHLSSNDSLRIIEKILDQKQQFYDSQLNALNLTASKESVYLAAGELVVIIILALFGFLGVDKLRDMQDSMTSDISHKLQKETKRIEKNIQAEVVKIATAKYGPDLDIIRDEIAEIKSKLNCIPPAPPAQNVTPVQQPPQTPPPAGQPSTTRPPVNPFDVVG
jgi:hypothetical protein